MELAIYSDRIEEMELMKKEAAKRQHSKHNKKKKKNTKKSPSATYGKRHTISSTIRNKNPKPKIDVRNSLGLNYYYLGNTFRYRKNTMNAINKTEKKTAKEREATDRDEEEEKETHASIYLFRVDYGFMAMGE